MSSASEKIVTGFMMFIMQGELKGKTVLDAACGFGFWGHMIRSLHSIGGSDCYLVGCDIFRPYLTEVKKYNPYDDFVLCDVRCLPFRNQALDYIISFEVLEHFDKKEGYAYLKQLKSLSNNIMVSTPCGFYPQGQIGKNPFEAHKAGWQISDFKNTGYSVVKTGLGGELEDAFRKFHLLTIFQKTKAILLERKWSGAILLAQIRGRAFERMNRSPYLLS